MGILKGRYEGAWSTWGEVPGTVKEMLWGEFGVSIRETHVLYVLLFITKLIVFLFITILMLIFVIKVIFSIVADILMGPCG